MPPIAGRSVVIPEQQAEWSLPVIAGIELKTLRSLAPGRAADLPKLQSALNLIRAYRRSSLAGEIDFRVVDLSQPRIRAHGEKYGFAIETMDLSVTNNVPVRWMLSPTIAEEARNGRKVAGR